MHVTKNEATIVEITFLFHAGDLFWGRFCLFEIFDFFH